MSEFNYPINNAKVYETLDIISYADKLNYWIFSVIKPYCNGNILEIGCGIGNISNYFISNGYKIAVSDISENYCRILKEKYSGCSNLLEVICMDIVHKSIKQKYQKYLQKFDTVFLLNILEHVEDDKYAVANCRHLLKDNGILIILVPAYNFLYNRFDYGLGHYRRYSKKMLNDILRQNGIAVINSFYFNAAGMAGWYISGNLLKKKIIPKGQMRFYNKLVPVFKIIDKLKYQ
ncbi:MAG: class I SAM-dependent methyltransferase [Bacteroidia bacterium]|nr:class I SAM-dependent methyltransferase [Bacteroidia bacterium]